MRASSLRYAIGGVLVALGILLLLSNTNIINLDWGWDFILTWWPILLILWGLWDLVSGKFRFRLWPIILLLLGIALQLSALNLWQWDFSVVWPAFIVIAGMAILLRRRGRRFRGQNVASDIIEGTTVSRPGSGNAWRAEFNRVADRYPPQAFRDGEMEVSFGGIVLDLKDATLPEEGCRLEVNLTFGEALLRVPSRWRVNLQGVSTHFSEVRDTRTSPENGMFDRELVISGKLSFGNLEIVD